MPKKQVDLPDRETVKRLFRDFEEPENRQNPARFDGIAGEHYIVNGLYLSKRPLRKTSKFLADIGLPNFQDHSPDGDFYLGVVDTILPDWRKRFIDYVFIDRVSFGNRRKKFEPTHYTLRHFPKNIKEFEKLYPTT